MSKCILCGNELLTGDIHWEQGLCNQCYKKTEKPDPFENIIVDRRKLDIREKYIEKLEQENKELKNQIEQADQQIQFLLLDTKKIKDLKQQLDKAEQELAFYEDEIKNRGTCGLCEKLENEQIKKLEQQLMEKDKQLAIKDRMIMLILKNTYYLDKEYFIEEIPTQDEYIVSQIKYWEKQAKESINGTTKRIR